MLPAATFKIRRDIFGILSVVLWMIASEGVVADRLRCEHPGSIEHGDFRLKRNFMRVICNNGYQLQGFKTIGCTRGKWDGERPVCARKGCSKDFQTPENGRIQIESDLKAILYCSDNYSLAGNHHMFCNGTHWDRPIGSCRERTDKVSHECDFETDDVCGWSYEQMANLEWKRVMAANVFTSFKTGPRHDHTTLSHNGGHYMLMESMVRQYMPVTLTSPVYDRELSLKTACCFQFHYFMYGQGIGDLLVVVKPVSISLEDVLSTHFDLIKFERNGNQNNMWNEAHFSIDEMEEDFQIVFVAKSGNNKLSDIAVDDVRLLTGDDCKSLDKNTDDAMSNEEFGTATDQTLYETQSCVGRCFNASDVGIIRTGGHLMGLCSCDADCEDADSCCPDFKTICLNELFDSSTVESATLFYAENAASTIASATTTTTKIVTTKATPEMAPTTTQATATSMTTTTTTTAKTTPTTPKETPTTPRTTSTTVRTTTTTTPKPKPPPPPPTKTTIRMTTTTTTPKPKPSTTKATTTTTTTTARPTTSTTTTTARPTTTTTTRKTITTTTATKATSPAEPTTLYVNISGKSRVNTPTQKPAAEPKSSSFVIDSAPKVEVAHMGFSVLTWTLIIIVIIVVVGLAYRRFGDNAVAWYMIHFSKRSSADEGTTSITTSLRSPRTTVEKDGRTSNARSRKKATYTNEYKRPLVEDDDDDDDDNGASNGNMALKNNIYTEL